MNMQNQTSNPTDVVYDESYFISKFEAIPFEKWITHSFEKDGCCCALGFCGVRSDEKGYANPTPESSSLTGIVRDKMTRAGFDFYGVVYVNDGVSLTSNLGDSPKERILTVLQATPDEIHKMLCRA